VTTGGFILEINSYGRKEKDAPSRPSSMEKIWEGSVRYDKLFLATRLESLEKSSDETEEIVRKKEMFPLSAEGSLVVGDLKR